MNSWSLLYDELMSDNDFMSVTKWGFEYTPLSESSTGNVDIYTDYEMNLNIDNKNGFWKYEEDVILKEIRDYLGGTYNHIMLVTTRLKHWI